MSSPTPAIEEPPQDCDILVIGGGPAGCTAATLLARRGHHVVMLEKDRHPRFHVGESLLPRNTAIFHDLGVAEEVAAIGVFKPGAEFVSESCGRRVAFPFNMAINGAAPAYQVRRADLDALLFRTAREAGATALEEARVTEMREAPPEGRALVRGTRQGEAFAYAPRFVVDASGRDAFLGGRLGGKSADKRNNTAAVFAHFAGVPPSAGDRVGFITVHLAEDGWFWSIPLPDGITSIGFVGMPRVFKDRAGDKEALLRARIAASPILRARMRDARMVSPVHAAGNYSYRCGRAWGEGWFLAGDAHGFLDPVFSSGVLLAMQGGQAAADVAEAWIADRRAGKRAARVAAREARRRMDGIAWLIHRINHPVLRGMFMAPSNVFRMRDGLISMLAGELRGGLRVRLPALAFKGVFYGLCLARKLRLPVDRPPPRLAAA